MARFLITGGAGFIGSNCVRFLLDTAHDVVVLDDFSTGRRENLRDISGHIEVIEGSICDKETAACAMRGVDYCMHLAAVPSVPRSVSDPWTSNRVNVEGAINVFIAARDAGVQRIVFASSSSVYGDANVMPLHEALSRAPISPYGVSKACSEHYAEVFSSLYDMDIVCFRYFNVFGPRQNPASQYAAVVPRFITQLLRNEAPIIFGDGLQSRDFTFVENVARANLQACLAPGRIAGIYNIACGGAVSVLELAQALGAILGVSVTPAFQPARSGDIMHSLADISRARETLGYAPTVSLEEGLRRTAKWYQENQEAHA